MGYKLNGIYVGDTQSRPVRGLPNTYRAVQYIQSSGTQYINTGYKHNANTKFEIKFNYQSMGGQWNMLCGARTSYNTADCLNLYVQYTTYLAYGVGGKFNDNYMSGSKNTDYTISVSKNNITINGTSLSLTTNLGSCNYNDYLFSVNNSGSHAANKISAKVYYFNIYESGVLVREFIPCYRISDDVIGMYDIVNGVFYTNAGSGTFTKGPDL